MLWDIASFQNQFDLPKGDLSASLLFLAKIKEIVPQGISKAQYAQSSANDGFEKNNKAFRGQGGKENDEEESGGRDGSKDNSGGDGDGDGGEGPTPSQPDSANDEIDPNTFYGYLFEEDKRPSKVLQAMLSGIARYIIDNIEPRNVRYLTPAKLSTFYKRVGGNYDSLWVDVPHKLISWIFASLACQHTLLPNTDDFARPSIPALTESGFVRWQSIEILLGPEEHVPFIQHCIEKFAIKNPQNNEAFPKGLSAESFPTSPDLDIEAWYAACAENLRLRATPSEEQE